MSRDSSLARFGNAKEQALARKFTADNGHPPNELEFQDYKEEQRKRKPPQAHGPTAQPTRRR